MTAESITPPVSLRFSWDELPYVSPNIAGTKGVIRQELADFQVTEIPLYLPEGKGSFFYAYVEKQGITSSELVKYLKQAGVAENRIGMAGLKDKYAITRQWLSIPNSQADAIKALEELDEVKVLETSRHKNKLGTGHLKSNHFRIRVRQAEAGAPQLARQALEVLKVRGAPNYFGPQRFGRFGNNAIDGYKVARGETVPGGRRWARFFVASLQSFVFNQLLALRLEQDIYNTVVTGDWAKKHDTGGVFLVEDGELETPRAKAGQISTLLPLFGKKVKRSMERAGELEQIILDRYQLKWHDGTMLRGDRRITRLFLEDAKVESVEDKEASNDYILSFTLPKGAFATSILREVMKIPVDEPSISTHTENADDENPDNVD